MTIYGIFPFPGSRVDMHHSALEFNKISLKHGMFGSVFRKKIGNPKFSISRII
jgi:hypothetical protein